MSKSARMAFILISFPKGSKGFLEVISILSKYEPFFLGSIHIPDPDSIDSLFGILVKANTDQLGAITGSLGKIEGVKIKSAVLPIDEENNKK